MRLLVQRVKKASVSIEGRTCGRIDHGLLVFVGIHKNDSVEDIPWFVNKLINLRIFSDDNKKMNLSVKDVKGSLLVISQFTLYANCTYGNRPSFIESAPPSIALSIYKEFLARLEASGVKVETGEFGADMEVSLINEGPVTIII